MPSEAKQRRDEKREKELVQSHVSPETKEQLIELAGSEQRSVSSYVKLVLEDHVQRKRALKPRRSR